jgi:hypothetical protein
MAVTWVVASRTVSRRRARAAMLCFRWRAVIIIGSLLTERVGELPAEPLVLAKQGLGGPPLVVACPGRKLRCGRGSAAAELEVQDDRGRGVAVGGVRGGRAPGLQRPVVAG